MTDRTRWGFGVLGVGAALGVLTDLLLNTDRLGVNLLLWVIAIGCGVLLLKWRWNLSLGGDGRWLVVPAVLAAAAFAWRDSPPLALLDLGVLFGTTLLSVRFTATGGYWTAGLGRLAAALNSGFWHLLGGSALVLGRDIEWKEVHRGQVSEQIAPVIRGLLIGLPLVLLFGVLFSGADLVFGQMVSRIFHFQLGAWFSHLITILIWTWIMAGLLRRVGRPVTEQEERGWSLQQPFALGLTEMGIILGLLNGLFLTFVIVQFRYFFGGAALVEAATGFTYAEYARRGFFELVAVVALVLPLLLVMHWLLPSLESRAASAYRWLASGLVAQLAVIMLSAFQRMRLYQVAYGLTERRLYTTAFMLWLGLLLLWFVVTVLRGQRERFFPGAIAVGLLVLGILHVINPDALIARTNLALVKEGRQFDAEYTWRLNADAVPALIAGLDQMGEEERKAVAAQLLQRWTPPQHKDWRSWNLARSQAWDSVSEQMETLRRMAGQ